MPAVKITFKFDRRLWSKPAIQKVILNAAKMVRDLWLARSPTLSGDYAKGLMKPQSIVVTAGTITVSNLSDHAAAYEYGTKAFNWGLATLKKGKNVKTAKDGSKYKIIRVKPTGRVAFRKPTVGAAVIASFRATLPRGRTVFAGYTGAKDIGRYQQHARLAKKLKARKPLKSAMNGFFVVSEKSIKADPRKWFHDKVPGHFVARAVQKQAEPIIKRAISQAVAAEAAAKARAKSHR